MTDNSSLVSRSFWNMTKDSWNIFKDVMSTSLTCEKWIKLKLMQIRNKSEINQKKILYSFLQENLLPCVFFSCFIRRNESRNAPGSIPYFIYFNCYNLICCHMLEKAFLNLLKLFSLIMSLFIFSQYFFRQILPSGQVWGHPTLLTSWFNNFRQWVPLLLHH